MAKTWYPVIDYAVCTECGICTEFCQNGVFDLKKAPTPVVRNPESCIDHCHGCGNTCPEGAITYAGDDTGWTPPKGFPEEEMSEIKSCGCGGDCPPVKKCWLNTSTST